jgi:multidrug efflux system outer membrane protein
MMTAACMVGPNYSRPAVEEPPAFKSEPPASPVEIPESGWWQLYADPELERLVAAANASNQTLRQAVARVDQARALARVAGSYLYPSVSADPAFSRTRLSATRANPTTGQPVGTAATINDWIIPADLSYEIDVWGRVRRSYESSRATARAAAADEAVVALTVQADVVSFYYTLRGLDAQDQILTQTVEAYREQVRILSVQLKNGLVGSIAVYQAQATLQTALAQQKDVRRARADLEHALAILCGRAAPSFSIAVHPQDDAPAPPCVPAALPADLLARRPDVVEAEQNVVAANAQVGVATADFYPKFMLTGSAGFESASASDLFAWQSRIASILPSISFPIFQGGRLKANLAATKAQYEQTVAAYVQQVLVAYGDVEDALTDLRMYTEEVGSLHEAVGASQNYLRLARVQYKYGLADYLVVIDAERTLLANQLLLAQTTNLQMGASVHLIKALGGGWEGLDQPSTRVSKRRVPWYEHVSPVPSESAFSCSHRPQPLPGEPSDPDPSRPLPALP